MTNAEQDEREALPTGWERVRLGNYFEFLRTGSASRADLSPHAGVGYVHYGDIHASPAPVWDLRSVAVPKIAPGKVSRLPRLRDGDIVMADASEDYEGIGKSVEIVGVRDHEVVAGLHTLLLRCRSGDPVLGFGAYLQFIPSFRRSVLRVANGISVYGISKRAVEGLIVDLPPRNEQHAIAEALGDIDALIASLDALIAKKLDVKQGAMQRLLTGATRLAGFAGPWRRDRVGAFCEFLRTGSASRDQLTQRQGIGYVHYGDIHASETPIWNLRDRPLPQIAPERVSRLPRLQDGDILIADASEDYEGVGKAVEVLGLGNQEVVGGLHTILMRRRDRQLVPGFGGYLQFIPDLRRGLIKIANGISVYGISKTGLATLEIDLPPPDEQRAIAAVLFDMDAEIEALQARRAKTSDLKKGMMRDLLTGRVRLTGTGAKRVMEAAE